MQEHHNENENHHLGHAGGGEELNHSSECSWHVRPDREQATGTDQIREQADREGSDHRAQQIADPTEHHQLVLASGRPEQIGFNVINQISFRVNNLSDLRALHQSMQEHGATDVQPVTHGNAVSIYFRDPEGNRLEVFFDTPWYVDQPMRVH